jgi:nitrate reductase delta subunit
MLLALARASAAVREPIEKFFATPGADSIDEYTQTIELSPPCPLYLGAYLFDEPTSCRGAGTSGRNGYMIELVNVYRHFGLELDGVELPDFLPVMVEFCAFSLERRELDGIGLRRRFLEQQLRPGLAPLAARLAEYESPYALPVTALEALCAEDLVCHPGTAWAPPDGERKPRRRLPVVSAGRRKEVRP